jgi:hypothetical protein
MQESRRPRRETTGAFVRLRAEADGHLPVARTGSRGDIISHEASMNIQLVMGPLLALIAGILILIVPRLLNYIVAIYLIVVGLVGLFGSSMFR